ncbi:hypothetical protein DFQ27_008020 [Actinomortierella ambigua]|uniref:Uncharacterized protein n=1 Tax=Actinomortierella ambigua TaxID=1343610 RepID=A0A9P6PRH7_9FUNG|nr:hypothetical protein DFQ27_008020 [Actinomortierella ambigua]
MNDRNLKPKDACKVNIAYTYAVANKKMSKTYTEAGEKLEMLKDCNGGEFESPLGTIHDKLAESQSHLKSL